MLLRVHVCAQCGAEAADTDRFCVACGAALAAQSQSSAHDPLIGRVIGGSYVLQEVVGVGGMGRVYRAEQSTLGRTVAVKVIHPHLLGDEQTVARFYQEARASSRLNHPNSVSIIDFGRTDDGILYLAMEFLTGRDLALLMHEEGPLAFDRIASILIGTLDALGEAHEYGVIHRDLKPENILVRRLRSGDDLVKVVDFGLATIVGNETSITTPGLVCGTPDYMSPEQGRGDPVDARGDLYSLGVVLFELLTGQLPFIDDTPTKVVLRHLNEPIPDPQQVAPSRQIPTPLSKLTMRALAKEADERFQSAKEMQDALNNVLEIMRVERAGFSQCPSCGSRNPLTDKFCGECGARLTEKLSEPPTSTRPSFYPPLGSLRTFVGRDAELHRVRTLRDQAAGGALWAHVYGHNGVGKTRFLTEVAEQLTGLGDLVIGAGIHPSGAPVAYYPISVLIAELLGCPRDELAATLEGREIIDDDPLVNAGLEEILDPRGLAGGDGQSRSGAVAAAVAACAQAALDRTGASALVLMVDDLNGCDGLTRQTIGQLPRALGAMKALLLTSGQEPRHGAESISLGGLDLDETRAFLATSGRLDVVTRLGATADYDSLRYSPLYLEQLEALSLSDDEQVPTRVADAIVQRTDRLSVEARRTLQTVSVLGCHASLESLGHLLTEEELGSLEELFRMTLMQPVEGGIAIVHPFIAEIVEASIPAEARRELHRAVYRLASELGLSTAVQAQHAYAGADPMTSLVVLERAGDIATSRGDGRGAVLWYRRALELARREALESGDTVMDTAIASFSRKLGEAMARSGDSAGADGVLREALDLTDRKSAARARMLLSLGRVAARRDRPRDAMRHFGQALELVVEVDPEIESELQVEIGRVRRAEGDPQHAANAFRRALELYEGTKSDAVTELRTRLELAEVLIATSDAATAAEHLTAVQFEATDVGAMSIAARAVGTVGAIAEQTANPEDARAHYATAAQIAAAAGDAPGFRRWVTAGQLLQDEP